MLFLVFRLGSDRYALDATAVDAVLPRPRLTGFPSAPAGIAGLFNYRGTSVPVLDLARILLGRPSADRLSTRLVLVHFPTASGVEPARRLGLLAENLTTTLQRTETDFHDSGVANPRQPSLGRVTADAGVLVQRIELSALVPPALRELLFQPQPAGAV